MAAILSRGRWVNFRIALLTPGHSHDCLSCQWNNPEGFGFTRRSKKTSKLRVTGLCAGNSPVTSEFPAQRASNAENVSIWWRHREEIESRVRSHDIHRDLETVSVSHTTSNRKISHTLESERSVFGVSQWFSQHGCRRLWNSKAVWAFQYPVSQAWEFARF